MPRPRTDPSLPPHVSRWSDRQGRERYRFRKSGQTFYFKSAPQTPEFSQELLAFEEQTETSQPLTRNRKALLTLRTSLLRQKAGAEEELARIDRELASVEAEIARSTDELFVYFIGMKSGPIKIGMSADPARRLHDLQTHNPKQLKLLATIPGDAALEQSYHRRFSSHRMAGEWFARHADILNEIRRLRAR